MKKHDLVPRQRGYTRTYDAKKDPRVPNVFAAASFRFGHTMIPDQLPETDPSNKPAWMDANNMVFEFGRFRSIVQADDKVNYKNS